MRLALQALFGSRDDSTEESRKRCERIKRELRGNQRSKLFLKKLDEVVSDPNLKAPEIFAKESFPDANIVAEYLDCQSESEDIREEYERVCLESPEILAEVGCCYDVLTNRLGRPLDAPKNCRHRLYYVAWEDDADSEGDPDPDSSEHAQVESVDDARPTEASVATTLNECETFASDESEVQKLMRSERRLGRRAARFLRKGVFVAATILGVVCAVSYWSGDKGSETIKFAEGQGKTDWQSGIGELSGENETTIDVESDVLSASEENLDDVLMSSDFITGDSDFITEDTDPYLDVGADVPQDYGTAYTAILPEEAETRASSTSRSTEGAEAVERSMSSDVEYGLYSNSGVSRTSSLRRVGLGSPDLELSEGIVIPSQNNDVFANSTRF